jgi:large subunit ribosomal protein L29
MKTSELRSKTIAELTTELEAFLKEQFNLRMQKGLGDNPRPQSIRAGRRNIARIKTIISEKAREGHNE